MQAIQAALTMPAPKPALAIDVIAAEALQREFDELRKRLTAGVKDSESRMAGDSRDSHPVSAEARAEPFIDLAAAEKLRQESEELRHRLLDATDGLAEEQRATPESTAARPIILCRTTARCDRV